MRSTTKRRLRFLGISCALVLTSSLTAVLISNPRVVRPAVHASRPVHASTTMKSGPITSADPISETYAKNGVHERMSPDTTNVRAPASEENTK